MSESPSVFNDPVHGYIELEPALAKIIHTPQFQRLKDIKQLGATYWVYPGASHNRFEHCLGTAYIAGKMIEALKDLHKNEIDITPQEVLCVKIAALCHDLGHGPFSHVFDTQIKAKLLELHPKEHRLKTWEHEDASCEMFDYMLQANKELCEFLEKRGIGNGEIELVKELIKGKVPGRDKVKQKATIDGKSYPKWFLFEIVANKRNGIDCDKFDYFARDCLNLGVKSNFDHTRYLQNIRILLVDDQLQICARDKLVFNIYEMFHTRWSLHHRVYQHKTTKAIEYMISEAFALTDHKFEFSNAIFDMEKYTMLTDSVFYEILRYHGKDERCNKAKEIIKRIQHRDLYKLCGETQPSPPLEIGALEIAEEIASFDENVNADDILVSKVEIHFGMKDKDPIDSVVFFNKDLAAVLLRKDVVSEMLPKKFIEQYVRVYVKNPKKFEALQQKDSSKPKDLVTSCFWAWCKKQSYSIPDLLTGDKTGYFTPKKSPRTVEDIGVSRKRARKELFDASNSE